jgi:anaerobic ribonucleoside-triphosphate reductase activating protein
LVQSVDLLIDGPFIEEKQDKYRVLLGSTNKNLTFITNRYINNKDYFDNPISIEEVTAEDYIFINGD